MFSNDGQAVFLPFIWGQKEVESKEHRLKVDSLREWGKMLNNVIWFEAGSKHQRATHRLYNIIDFRCQNIQKKPWLQYMRPISFTAYFILIIFIFISITSLSIFLSITLGNNKVNDVWSFLVCNLSALNANVILVCLHTVLILFKSPCAIFQTFQIRTTI